MKLSVAVLAGMPTSRVPDEVMELLLARFEGRNG
jgi:hypothetical protein